MSVTPKTVERGSRIDEKIAWTEPTGRMRVNGKIDIRGAGSEGVRLGSHVALNARIGTFL